MMFKVFTRIEVIQPYNGLDFLCWNMQRSLALFLQPDTFFLYQKRSSISIKWNLISAVDMDRFFPIMERNLRIAASHNGSGQLGHWYIQQLRVHGYKQCTCSSFAQILVCKNFLPIRCLFAKRNLTSHQNTFSKLILTELS